MFMKYEVAYESVGPGRCSDEITLKFRVNVIAPYFDRISLDNSEILEVRLDRAGDGVNRHCV
jgi:hypothetical protein